MGGLGFDDIVTSSSPTKEQTYRLLRPIKDDDAKANVGLGGVDSSPKKKKTKDRYRDAPSPKSILDRDALIEALNSHNILLKDGQLDMFYALLHRCGYPSNLKEFVSELRHGGDTTGRGLVATLDGGGNDVDDDSSTHEKSKTSSMTNNYGRTKNAISARPGRRNIHHRLPDSFLTFLSSAECNFVTLTSNIVSIHTSLDKSTTKIIIQLHDGHNIESVIMKHDNSRVTQCISSQVGCAMACTFCATGTMGMRGNLSTGEILEQLVHGSRVLTTAAASTTLDQDAGDDDDTTTGKNGVGMKVVDSNRRMDLVRNVVFMGMGEPLNNYDNVLAACKALIDRRLWNLAHNRVTVSTVGVPSRMRDLTRDLPEVNLALSLHAPNQKARERIVPAARGTPIESLIDALDGHMMAPSLARRKKKLLDNPQGEEEFNTIERLAASKKKRAMVEYVMLEGDTTTIEAAHQLGKLCEGRHLVVNLIPYNKTDVKDKLSCPSDIQMREFQKVVQSYGSFCTIRRTMGADIAGACGQLVVNMEEKNKVRRDPVVDIEDGPFVRKDEVMSAQTRRNIHATKRRNTILESANKEGSNFDDSDVWVRRFTVATLVAATCFVTSSAIFLFQKRKR
jgi:adenine C2-methylase RlmN of 23S rRNA A2503 and tRNA A37